MDGRTSNQTLPQFITDPDDIVLFVGNFRHACKQDFPENALAFVPLLYIDPHQLPEDILEHWGQSCDDLVRILTASNEHDTRRRLFESYLPVTASEPELLHWIGQLRVAHGLYFANLEEILHGYDHQVESLVAVGLIDEAKQTIQHINSIQSELGRELINTDYLLTQLDSSTSDEQPVADDLTYIESTFSIAERNPRIGLTDLDVNFETVAANLSAATVTQVEQWVRWFATIAANGLNDNDLHLVSRLDKTLIEALFVHNPTATAVEFDKAIQPWYELFHKSSLGVLDQLSPRTVYYALSLFAKATTENPAGVHNVEGHLNRLSTVAAELGDYKTSLEAINKKTRYAQNNRNYEQALTAARQAHAYGEKLLQANHTTANPEVLWATRSLAQLLSWAGQKSEAADLLLAVPKRFTFADLNFNGQINYIFSRIELAQLFHEARQEDGRRVLLTEAADLYESIELKSEAIKLRQTHKL